MGSRHQEFMEVAMFFVIVSKRKSLVERTQRPIYNVELKSRRENAEVREGW